MLSVSAVSNYLTILLLSSETFSYFGAFVPFDNEFGDYQSVVSPAVCTAYGLCDFDIMLVPLPYNDIAQ